MPEEVQRDCQSELGENCRAAPIELKALDDRARRRLLVARTAMLTSLFHRWTSTHREAGLSYSSIRLLELLQGGGAAIMRGLADQLGVSARNMTAAVDALEEAGLVRRVAHPNDRRAILVELTPRGARTAAQREAELDSIATVFDALSDEEQQQLLGLLGRLVDQIGRACGQSCHR